MLLSANALVGQSPALFNAIKYGNGILVCGRSSPRIRKAEGKGVVQFDAVVQSTCPEPFWPHWGGESWLRCSWQKKKNPQREEQRPPVV